MHRLAGLTAIQKRPFKPTSSLRTRHHCPSPLALSADGRAVLAFLYRQRNPDLLRDQSLIGTCRATLDTRPANVISATTNSAPTKPWSRICEPILATSLSSVVNRIAATRPPKLVNSPCTRERNTPARNRWCAMSRDAEGGLRSRVICRSIGRSMSRRRSVGVGFVERALGGGISCGGMARYTTGRRGRERGEGQAVWLVMGSSRRSNIARVRSCRRGLQVLVRASRSCRGECWLVGVPTRELEWRARVLRRRRRC